MTEIIHASDEESIYWSMVEIWLKQSMQVMMKALIKDSNNKVNQYQIELQVIEGMLDQP